jgi:hypothetical protein
VLQQIFIYLCSSLLIIIGIICLQTAFRKPSSKEKMMGRQIPVDGKGGKADLIYLELHL